MNEPFDTTQGGQLDRIELKLAELQGKVEETYASVDKMRKYMLWTAIITVAVIIIPILILPLFLPAFLSSQGVGNLNSVQGLQ
ncbi:MAG: hypothetical protein KGH79_01055 [Patescibacteria group bacterium]|nr:hypothetical protein [Patescibacteria group bacterium]